MFGVPDGAAPTVAVQDGPVRARATGYGEPFAYRPEDRPFMAVDGDPATAWRVADRAAAEGEQIRLDIAEPIDHLTLHQPAGAAAVRHIGEVTIAVDDLPPQRVVLDERSLQPDGQRVDIVPTTAREHGDDHDRRRRRARPVARAGAGGGRVRRDRHRPRPDRRGRPSAERRRDGPRRGRGSTPVSFVFTRLRTRPSDRWRSDPEPTMVRELELPTARSFVPQVSVRLDQRAPDAVLAGLLGISGPTASRRLTGTPTTAGWAAVDGDPATSWTTPFGAAVGATLELVNDAERTSLELTQPSGEHSPITGIRLHAGGTTTDVEVPAPDATGTSVIELPSPLPAGPVQLEVASIDPRAVLDRRYAEPVVLPAAISEVSIGARTAVPERLDTGCRADLLTVDGQPVPVRIEAATADLLAGDAVDATPCTPGELTLAAGRHRLATTAGAATGLHVDRIVLADPAAGRPAETARRSRRSRSGRRAGRVATSPSRGAPRGAGSCSARASTRPGRHRRRTATSDRRNSSTVGSTAGGSRPATTRSTSPSAGPRRPR